MERFDRRARLAGALIVGTAVVCAPALASAYVGPGAGIAVATTALALLVTIIVVVFSLLLWPFRQVYRLITRRRPPNPPRVKRAVIIGLDGLDPKVTRRLMEAGELPNMQRIAEAGTFRDLGTTYPAMSPVAWSTFATGVNPAKHAIFDFLTRDRHSYMPDLSSSNVGPPRRHLSVGPYRLPVGKPRVELLRRSKPFWKLLGRHRIPCSVLRVPITFPPEPFDGTVLSAMCVPDLQGTQGSFTYYSSAGDTGAAEGGRRVSVEVVDGRCETRIDGPPNPIRRDGRVLSIPLRIDVDREAGRAELRIGRTRVPLELDEYTDWIPVAFPLGLGFKLRGMCRFRLLEVDPHLRLYVTPINIDPDRPVLPISHPKFFATYLSKLVGRFTTLGLAEDTWALNEGVLDEDAFLEQAWSNHAEREAMFFHMLRRTPRGLIACVFDGTDRIQHMFMRHAEDDHPSHPVGDDADRYREVIDDTYRRMDEMVGRVLDEVDISDPDNLVAVMSDHGFQTFRRGVNLNSWLLANGYLALKEDADASGEWFDGVDWSCTRAYALGLGGIFLNVSGRERDGIVEPGDADAVAREIAEALTGIVDEEGGGVAIRAVHVAADLYTGPYADEAPELIIGYAAGWRASWDGVRGMANATIFDDNTKAWSGDHCIDPDLVPGVLISSQTLGGERRPEICDMAPTMLELFGIPAPRYMDGRSLCVQAAD